MKNQFEQHIKQSLESYEVPYNPADWTDLENRMRKARAGRSANIGKGLVIAASAVAVAGLIYYFSNTDTGNNIPEKTTTISQSSIHSQAAEKSVQQVEPTNKQQVIGNLPANIGTAVNDKSTKEKVLATDNAFDKKIALSDKTENNPENKTVETSTHSQERIQPSSITPQPSTTSVLNASFHADMNKVCAGTPVQFTTDNTNVSCSFQWNFGDGEFSTEQNPIHIYTRADTYFVRLRVTSSIDRKISEQSTKEVIVVYPVPAIEMNWNVSTDASNPAIAFEAKAKGITDWKWDFGDKQSSAEQNPMHVYSKNGNYSVVLTAKNTFGCTSAFKKEVNVEYSYNLLAPTSFTPNGDGLNDTWIPVALLDGDKNFWLTIFDKTGEVIYKTSDKNRPWDGQGAKTGETFMWKAVVKDKNGDESNYQGLITIADSK